jgi:hypothetical protein
MRKTLFEGVESDLLVFKNLQNEVVIEMLEKGCNLNDIQLGDSYNHIILNKEDVVFLGQLLIQLSSNE